MDKSIMVVPNTDPFAYQVFPFNTDDLNSMLTHAATARDRSEVETDDSVRQVIPYILVMGGSDAQMGTRFLSAVRKSGGNEERLYGGITLGFGGHVKWEGDSDPVQAFYDSVFRELEEELNILPHEITQPEVHGVIVDDTDAVGSVHLGILISVRLLEEDRWASVRSAEPDTLKAFWTTMSYAGSLEPRMEGWARLTYQYLVFSAEMALAQQQQLQMGIHDAEFNIQERLKMIDNDL